MLPWKVSTAACVCARARVWTQLAAREHTSAQRWLSTSSVARSSSASNVATTRCSFVLRDGGCCCRRSARPRRESALFSPTILFCLSSCCCRGDSDFNTGASSGCNDATCSVGVASKSATGGALSWSSGNDGRRELAPGQIGIQRRISDKQNEAREVEIAISKVREVEIAISKAPFQLADCSRVRWSHSGPPQLRSS